MLQLIYSPILSLLAALPLSICFVQRTTSSDADCDVPCQYQLRTNDVFLFSFFWKMKRMY